MCKKCNYNFQLIYARCPGYSVPWYMRDTHMHACIQTSLSSISCNFLVEDYLLVDVNILYARIYA